MPRVRISNASLVASADCPILPFLAPSVFAASSYSQQRHQQQQHGGCDRAQKEEREKLSSRGHAAKSCPQKIDARPRQVASSLRQHHALRGNDASLPSRATILGDVRRRTTPSSVASASYTAIASYFKPYARSLSTDSRDDEVRRAWYTPTTAERQMRETSPSPSHDTEELAVRRQQLLHNTKIRYTRWLEKHHGATMPQKLADAEYRSLRRRLLNYENWSATQLDLTQAPEAPPSGNQIIQAFAALDRSTFFHDDPVTARLVIQHNPEHVRWTMELIGPWDAESPEHLKSNWNKLGSHEKGDVAFPTLIFLLDRKPGRALDFVKVLARENDSDNLDTFRVLVADALEHLAKIHVKGRYPASDAWHEDPTVSRLRFVSQYIRIYSTWLHKAGRSICSQASLLSIIDLATPQKVYQLFERALRLDMRILFNTMLHFAEAFAHAGDIQRALLCLDDLRLKTPDEYWADVVSHEKFRWCCATILRTSMTEAANYHDTPKIVATFVELGVKLDILLYNIVMNNAMDADDYPTAFKVYNTLEDSGLKPDQSTLSILLHGCARQENPTMFADFVQYCTQMARDTQDQSTASAVLYHTFTCHYSDPDIEVATSHLWSTYLRLFDAGPLEPLISRRRNDLQFAIAQQRAAHAESFRPGSTVLEPTPFALFFMLSMEIKLASKTSNQLLKNLYQDFQLLITMSDSSPLMELKDSPIIWNTFLYAFGRKKQFASASQVIRDMTKRSVNPNVFTWNILMQAFFRDRQVQAAERVFEIMQSQGVDPDRYTYGVMVRGYAKAQLVDRVGGMMRFLDTKDQLNPDLLKVLADIVDRKELMFHLENNRKEKDAEAAEEDEARAEAEAAQEEWTAEFVREASLRQLDELETMAKQRTTETIETPLDQEDRLAKSFSKTTEVMLSMEEETDEDPTAPTEAISARTDPDPGFEFLVDQDILMEVHSSEVDQPWTIREASVPKTSSNPKISVSKPDIIPITTHQPETVPPLTVQETSVREPTETSPGQETCIEQASVDYKLHQPDKDRLFTAQEVSAEETSPARGSVKHDESASIIPPKRTNLAYFMHTFMGVDRASYLTSTMLDTLREKLVGAQVRIKHEYRFSTISGIAEFDQTPSKFKIRQANGDLISVAAYLSLNRGKALGAKVIDRIIMSKCPCIIIASKNGPKYFPAELLQIEESQPAEQEAFPGASVIGEDVRPDNAQSASSTSDSDAPSPSPSSLDSTTNQQVSPAPKNLGIEIPRNPPRDSVQPRYYVDTRLPMVQKIHKPRSSRIRKYVDTRRPVIVRKIHKPKSIDTREDLQSIKEQPKSSREENNVEKTEKLNVRRLQSRIKNVWRPTSVAGRPRRRRSSDEAGSGVVKSK